MLDVDEERKIPTSEFEPSLFITRLFEDPLIVIPEKMLSTIVLFDELLISILDSRFSDTVLFEDFSITIPFATLDISL
jgi:hypothetical protein